MSALGLAPAPLERVGADLVVVPLFADERPLRGAAGRVDWRLCGRLSHLCASGRVRGHPGGAVLIPGGGGVRAPRVLGLGLGPRAGLDAELWERWVDDALLRARALCARELVVALPEAGERHRERLVALSRRVAQESEDTLVWVAPEPEDAAAVAEWLGTAARRARSEGVEIRGPGERRSPHGAQRPASPAESSRAPAGRFTR